AQNLDAHPPWVSSTPVRRQWRILRQNGAAPAWKWRNRSGGGWTMADAQVRTVGILIFDDVEVLDFCGPFEVFSVARRPGENADEQRLFDVRTIAQERRTVTCRGGLLVEPHLAINDGDAGAHF